MRHCAYYRYIDVSPLAVYANSFLAAYVSVRKIYQSRHADMSCRLNTRRISRGRGTDAETNTMPTFLMVGKVTQRTIHLDAEQGVRGPPPPLITSSSF